MATSNVVISEGQVTFKGVQGHKHDGILSTLIDTSKYSIFDFIVAENAKDSSRASAQANRKEMLKTFIISTVEDRVLKPTGIALQANSITAREIVSGTITADQLSSNIILVNNIIRSNNYINNTGTYSGWAIFSNGTANFNNVNIRGNIYLSNTGGMSYNSNSTAFFANSVGYFSLGNKFTWDGSSLTITGNATISGTVTIAGTAAEQIATKSALGGSALQPGSAASDVNTYNTNISGNRIRTGSISSQNGINVIDLSAGTINFGSGNFTVDGSGNVGVAGTITATDGYIGGLDIGSTYIQSTDYIANPSTAGFRINSNGAAVFNEVTVRGTMDASTIIGSSMSMVSTPFMGFSYDQYRLNFYDTAKIRAEMRYQCDANGDGASVTSYVDINNVGSAIDGARVGVTSTTGGNTQIRAGFVDANLMISGPMRPVLAAASPTHIGVDSGGYISYVTSRRELKYEIENFIELDIIDQFVPRTFKWKKTGRGEESEVQRIARESEYAIGFIVEEVEEIQNGRFVTYEDSDRTKPLYWKTDNFIAMLVAEVQDLRKRVKELENGV